MGSISTELLIIFILILGNGLFAMTEIAIISSRKARLQQEVEKGNRRARVALHLANNPGRFLSTVQIGITLIGILAGAFGGLTIAKAISNALSEHPLLGPYSHLIGLAVVVAGITYATLIFGELVPKRIALNYPERIAMIMSLPMRVTARAAAPAVYILSRSTDLVLRLMGIKPSSDPAVTEEEIKIMIDQGTEAGIFEEGEHEMLGRVFQLADRRVSELMTPRPAVVWLDLNAPFSENKEKLLRYNFARFPVCRGSLDQLVGVVHINDLLNELLAGRKIDFEALLQQPLLVAKNTRALRVLELFKETGTHIAILIDEYGVIQGLVTLNDILVTLTDDTPPNAAGHQRAVQRADGSWLLDGRLSTNEFRDIFPRTGYLPGEEIGNFRTLGGFVITHLGRIPTTAEFFTWRQFRFEVVDMDGNRVDKILVTETEDNDHQTRAQG